MIEDARVLQTEWVPREVEHRNPELNVLSNALDPITDGEPAETALLVGPSGVGKTCCAQFTLERLRETVLDIEYQRVNCWQDYSRFRTLYRILDGIGETLDIHRQSTAHDELLERLRDYDGPPYVVVLDEVDQLEDTRVLYDLYSIDGLSMILIANREEDLFGRLDDRVVSRLQSARRVRFEKYGLEQVVSILESRVRWGLEEGAIERPELERIADTAAGDARVAIGILRAAAREAEQRDVPRITDDILDVAIPQAEADITRSTVEKLNEHQRILYNILAEEEELRPPALYEAYRDRINEPRTNRTVRNYLQKMAHYNLIRAEGDGRARTYLIDGSPSRYGE
jgi:orc1/cdc6 family replication initiation protein